MLFVNGKLNWIQISGNKKFWIIIPRIKTKKSTFTQIVRFKTDSRNAAKWKQKFPCIFCFNGVIFIGNFAIVSVICKKNLWNDFTAQYMYTIYSISFSSLKIMSSGRLFMSRSHKLTCIWKIMFKIKRWLEKNIWIKYSSA